MPGNGPHDLTFVNQTFLKTKQKIWSLYHIRSEYWWAIHVSSCGQSSLSLIRKIISTNWYYWSWRQSEWAQCSSHRSVIFLDESYLPAQRPKQHYAAHKKKSWMSSFFCSERNIWVANLHIMATCCPLWRVQVRQHHSTLVNGGERVGENWISCVYGI